MTLAYPPLLLLLVSGSMVAQQMSHPVMASRDDSFSAPRPAIVQAETLNVLAVMVQFQPDGDTRTTGDGRFDLSAPVNPVLDASPRDRAYFESHLAFAASYYAKASKGKLVLRSTVVDQVITLPSTMAAYSPPRNALNTAVGNLAVESWRAVDSLGLVPDFSRYDCFVVFHAGTGRDIDLVNTLGYDPTPFDIPSLYLGIKAFRSFYGQDYPGIPVNGGSYHITTSVVLPETESRFLPGLTGDVLLELSINGLLCSSIGNHLGLPDLFNTRTGSSGIGRFGLMDGQAIFSFAGTFPPEPSAWEKYWLGWIQPVTLEAGTHNITLPAVGMADTVYRLPVSAQEYFLVENRNRDPQRNGQTVTYVYNGISTTRTFLQDTTDFNAFNLTALAGVVTDVEDPDWSLPGGRSQDGTFYDGGVLIWHIDEAVIARGLTGDGVNADPLLRGVDVEEADGSQDIGQSYGFLSPGSGSEEGTPLDYWYEGNTAPVYRNEFSATSHPDAMSNNGARSHVSIGTFSARGPRMTAVATVGDDVILPLPGFPRRMSSPLADNALAVDPLTFPGRPSLILTTRSGLYAWDPAGLPALPGGGASGRMSVVSGGSLLGASMFDREGDGTVELLHWERPSSGPQGDALHCYTTRDENSDSLADELFLYQSAVAFTSLPSVGDSLIAVGLGGNRALVLNLAGRGVDSSLVNTDAAPAPITGVAVLPHDRTFCFLSASGTVSIVRYAGGSAAIQAERRLGVPVAGAPVIGRFGGSWGNGLRIALVTTGGSVFVLDSLLNTMAGFPVETAPGVSTGPALGDLDADGTLEIVVASGSRIHALNLAGASLDYFPVTAPGAASFTSNPVIGDLDADGLPEVVAVTREGLVVSYDGHGRLTPGFPLQAGTGTQAVTIAAVLGDLVQSVDIVLSVASSDTSALCSWRTGVKAGPIPAGLLPSWGQYQGDARHSGLAPVPSAGAPRADGFFPAERAYNWPNPVYNGSTFIRYFVRDNATVSIRIFDLAGDLVTEFAGPGVGGVDNEVEWRTGDIQSGVYLARIEASGQGESGTAVVKVAVVK
jgi:hypothetical protein